MPDQTLDAITALPVPEIVSPTDVSIPSTDGLPLKGWHWSSRDPRGIVIITHGLGEHSAIYRSLAEYLVPAIGVDVLAFDLLGHGRSPGRRGHLVRYDQLIENLSDALRWASQERPDIPRFVLGHSNGGVIATLAILREPSQADGLILSNPALRLKYRPPRHKLALGHLLRIAAPWVTLGGPVPAEGLSRDPLQQVTLQSDRLMHTRIGAPLFFGMREAGRIALERSGELDLPLLIVLGQDDPIIDPETGRSFFERFGGTDKTLLDLPGFRHDPLFERDRGTIYHRIASWLLPRVTPPPAL